MGLLDKILGKKEEEKKPEKKKPAAPKNEFAEDEKTFDGVIRQLKSDLHKDTIVGPNKRNKK